MKRFFIILTVLSLILIYFVFPVSALDVDLDDFYIPPELTSIPLRSIFETSTVLNSFGDTETDISIFPQRYYFQLWQTRLKDSGKWLDYIGAFKNELPKFEYDSLAGRVRPFGNSKLNIGSSSGDIVDGYFYPYSRLEYVSELTFTFGFNVQDLDHTGNMLPPAEDLTGYFYLFDVASYQIPSDSPELSDDYVIELRLANKRGFPITYSYDYDSRTYTGRFTCSLDVKLDRYSTNSDIVGFIPLFTFYQLDFINLDGSSVGQSKLFFPTFKITSKYFYQQKLLYELDSFQNGSSSIIDTDNLAGKSEILSGHLDDFVGSQSGYIKVAQQDASKAIGNHIDSVLSLSAILNLFLEIGFFKDIILISMTLGVIAVMLNVVVSSAGNVSGFVKRESKRRKD